MVMQTPNKGLRIAGLTSTNLLHVLSIYPYGAESCLVLAKV